MAMEEENQRLRRLLAFAYSGTALYCDDGELSDSHTPPFIDFKRDSVDEIERKMNKRTEAAIKEAGGIDAILGKATESERQGPTMAHSTPADTDLPLVLTREDMCELFHITGRTLSAWVAEGKAPTPDISSTNGKGQRWFRQRVQHFLETGKVR